MKVAHFQVYNLPHPDNVDRSISIPRNYTTAHIRIPHYTSHALSHIHFPSLTKLHIDFPLTRKRQVATGDAHSDLIEDVQSIFPILATQLGAHACNKLQHLYLNCNRLMQYEKGGYLASTYEIFGQNLSRCCNELKEVTIVNTGTVRGVNTPMYSVGLTNALVSMLKRRKDTIQKFDYEVRGLPILHHHYTVTGGANVSSDTNCDLFDAVLQLTKLERLCIKCSFGHFFDFVKATAREKTGVKTIRDLAIVCQDIEEYERNHDSFQIVPMLDHFTEYRSIQRLYLKIPSPCWREAQTLEALANLLLNQPELISVRLWFPGFDDKEGKIIKCMSDILPKLALNSCNDIRLSGLSNVDYTQLFKLKDCMEKLRFACLFERSLPVIGFIRVQSKRR